MKRGQTNWGAIDLLSVQPETNWFLLFSYLALKKARPSYVVPLGGARNWSSKRRRAHVETSKTQPSNTGLPGHPRTVRTPE
jgi:hypothetical protein